MTRQPPSLTHTAPVLVFGEALVDVFGEHLQPGGAPFNVACHLAALGVESCLISRVGADAYASQLQATAERMHLMWDTVQTDAERPTGRVVVQQTDNGHTFEISANQAYDHIDARQALRHRQVCQAINSPSAWLYHGTLALRYPASYAAWKILRGGCSCRVFVDMNWRSTSMTPSHALLTMRDADVAKLNDDELELLMGWLGLDGSHAHDLPGEGEQRDCMASLMRILRISMLLVTHGARGAACWGVGGHCAHARKATPVSGVIDTVGAGDAFSSAMLAALSLNLSLARALNTAVEFAAAICTIRGAMPADASFHAPWRNALVAPAKTLLSECGP